MVAELKPMTGIVKAWGVLEAVDDTDSEFKAVAGIASVLLLEGKSAIESSEEDEATAVAREEVPTPARGLETMLSFVAITFGLKVSIVDA